jgi:hypothetical protein
MGMVLTRVALSFAPVLASACSASLRITSSMVVWFLLFETACG